MDNNYRKNWDKTLIELEQLQVDESNGTEIGLIIKKFPLLTAREYLLAWRVWESKDGTLYCFSKVPVELDTITNISGLAFPETSTTNSSVCQIACEGSERKFSRRPSNKLTANGLILLGGAICMSRGQLGCKDCHRICPD